MRTTLPSAGLLLLAATLAFGHHGPDTVTIDAAARKQPPVTFNHDLHSTKLADSCETCHHTSPGLTAESGNQPPKCSKCHLDPKGKIPSMREMSLTANPFHAPLCIGCHREQKKGPTVCKECHVRK